MSCKRHSIKSPVVLIGLSYLAFVSLGLPDGILGVTWPSMRASFDVPLESLGVLLLTFTAGYLITSFVSGYVLTRFSLGTALTVSTIAMATSLVAYSVSPYWWVLVGFVLIGGLGSGALDASLNTVVATNYSARVVNWLHASYGLGATLGPIFMTGALTSGWRWQWVYGLLAIGQFILAATFALARTRWHLSGNASEPSRPVIAASSAATLQLPAMWLSIALFAIYTGIEVTAGQWTFTLLTEGREIPISMAGMWVSFYWGALTVGRIGLGTFMGVMPVKQLLRICLVGATFGAALFWLNVTPWLSIGGLTLLGLALGPIFPSLIATTSSRIGASNTPNAVGFQITAATLGGSLLPGIVGVLAGNLGLEAISISLTAGVFTLLLLHELTKES